MGLIEKQGLRITIISYIGMVLGYINKAFLFMILLSTEEMGAMYVLLPTAALFAQFSNLGSVNTVWKFFPYLKNKSKNHNGFLAFNFLIILFGTLVFGLLLIIFDQQISDYFIENSALFVQYYYWILPAGIGILLYKFLDAYMKAIHKNVFSVLVNDFILRLVTTIILLIYAMGVMSFDNLVVVISLSQFIPGVLIIFYLIRIGEWGVRLKHIDIPQRFKRIIFSYSIFSYLNTIGSSVVMSLDVIMITSLIGLEANAVYGLVLLMTRALLIPYTSIIRVSTPLVAIMWKERTVDKLNKLYKGISSLSLIIGLYVFLGAWFSINEIFSLLKPEFISGIEVFFFLMIGKVFDAFMGLNGVILISSKKYKYDLYLTILLIVVGVILNIILIPIWGIVGAAIATSLAYLFYNTIRMLVVWKVYGIHPFSKNQLFIVFWFLILFALVHFFPFTLGNIFVSMVVKSLFISVLFLGVFYKMNIQPEFTSYCDRVLTILKKKLKIAPRDLEDS